MDSDVEIPHSTPLPMHSSNFGNNSRGIASSAPTHSFAKLNLKTDSSEGNNSQRLISEEQKSFSSLSVKSEEDSGLAEPNGIQYFIS